MFLTQKNALALVLDSFADFPPGKEGGKDVFLDQYSLTNKDLTKYFCGNGIPELTWQLCWQCDRQHQIVEK